MLLTSMLVNARVYNVPQNAGVRRDSKFHNQVAEAGNGQLTIQLRGLLSLGKGAKCFVDLNKC